MASRTVLVTGTSSGIGLETAVAAAADGWTVVATVRDPQRADTLREAATHAGAQLDIQAMDVTDQKSVTACVQRLMGRHGRLDAVVNNAGAAHIGTVETDELDGIRACLEVNFFGVVAVSQAAMPHLRASGGHLLTVSSVGGVVGQPFNEAYCAAKFAVEGFMESLAPVARTVGVRVSLVEPGAVASKFVANAGLDPAALVGAAGPYRPALQAYLDRTMQQFSGAAQSGHEVAQIIVGLLDAQDPPLRTQTSPWAESFVAAKLADVDGSKVVGMTRGWVSA